MKRALTLLFVLAPVTLLFLLPLYTIGAVAGVVWFSLSCGWDIGLKLFGQFCEWALTITRGKGNT